MKPEPIAMQEMFLTCVMVLVEQLILEQILSEFDQGVGHLFSVAIQKDRGGVVPVVVEVGLNIFRSGWAFESAQPYPG